MESINPHEPEKFEEFCEYRAKGLTFKEISLLVNISDRQLKTWSDTPEAVEKISIYRKKEKNNRLLRADKVVGDILHGEDNKTALEAAKLTYKLEGELVDKVESKQTITITADEIQKVIEQVTSGKE